MLRGVVSAPDPEGLGTSEGGSAFNNGNFRRSQVLGIDTVETLDVIIAGLSEGEERGREGGREGFINDSPANPDPRLPSSLPPSFPPSLLSSFPPSPS